jgi:hypothetical protein
LKVSIAADGTKNDIYLANVTNAVNLSQPSVCIGGGLHAPPFRTALSKPRNLPYFPLKIRSRPKKGENRPGLRTERHDFWVSKIARLREDTTQKTTTIFVRNGIKLLELRPSKNTVTPDDEMPKMKVGGIHNRYFRNFASHY